MWLLPLNNEHEGQVEVQQLGLWPKRGSFPLICVCPPGQKESGGTICLYNLQTWTIRWSTCFSHYKAQRGMTISSALTGLPTGEEAIKAWGRPINLHKHHPDALPQYWVNVQQLPCSALWGACSTTTITCLLSQIPLERVGLELKRLERTDEETSKRGETSPRSVKE